MLRVLLVLAASALVSGAAAQPAADAVRLGQQVIAENRVGASGNIGVDALAKAAPDGYTIGIVTGSTHAVAPSLNPNLPYDPIKDFRPITMIGAAPYMLVVYPGLPAKNLAELIALAKAKPDTLNYGSAGPASLAHLASASFASLAGIRMTHAPYKSSSQSVVDMITGRLDMQFATIAPTLPNIRARQLRALVTTGKQRVSALPDIPTVAESGLPGYEVSLWLAFMVPAAATPAAIATRLHSEITALLSAPETKESLQSHGYEAEPGPPDAIIERIRTEIEKFAVAPSGLPPKQFPRRKMSMSAEIQALKEKLVLACQILANEGQGDFIWGHVTVRSPERPDHIFMKPHMLGLSDVEAEDVITVDIDGNKVEGKGRRHTEVFIHTEIMRARPDVQCVVHTHPPHCIVFGALGKKMQPIGHYGSLFCEALPVFDKTTDLITDQVWGRAVAQDLGDQHVLLLRNHGIVATGPYIEEAVMRALFLDLACRMQITAESAGGAKLLSPEKDWRRKQNSLIKRDHMEAAFAHLVRKLHNK